MATKRQKREAGRIRSELFMAEYRASGLAAQKADQEHRAAMLEEASKKQTAENEAVVYALTGVTTKKRNRRPLKNKKNPPKTTSTPTKDHLARKAAEYGRRMAKLSDPRNEPDENELRRVRREWVEFRNTNRGVFHGAFTVMNEAYLRGSME